MDEYTKEKIKKLANLRREDIGKSEEDVKINFIVPLFEALGHERLKFEHRWKDVLIEELDPTCKIIIETKRYGKDLIKEIGQLKRYCDEERPLLGLITNGEEIWIFSPFWRFRPNFQDTLIYRIKREELKDEMIISILENMFSEDSLKSGKVKDFIINREKEIEQVENEIKKIEKEYLDKEKELQNRINELNQELEKIKNEIKNLNTEKEKVSKNVKEKIKQIREIHHIPSEYDRYINKKPIITKYNKSYTETDLRYLKMLDNPNSLPSKIKSYIEEEGEVTYGELKKICVEKFGCKSEKSGSIGASVKILEKEGYIRIEGRGDSKRLLFVRE